MEQVSLSYGFGKFGDVKTALFGKVSSTVSVKYLVCERQKRNARVLLTPNKPPSSKLPAIKCVEEDMNGFTVADDLSDIKRLPIADLMHSSWGWTLFNVCKKCAVPICDVEVRTTLKQEALPITFWQSKVCEPDPDGAALFRSDRLLAVKLIVWLIMTGKSQWIVDRCQNATCL